MKRRLVCPHDVVYGENIRSPKLGNNWITRKLSLKNSCGGKKILSFAAFPLAKGHGPSRGKRWSAVGRYALQAFLVEDDDVLAVDGDEAFGGEVPQTIEELITIPGVARKTANVVLWGAFGINHGLAVDTHVKRISFRLGLTKNTDPVKIEQDLMKIFPQSEWGDVNHRLVWFGRDVCDARKPACEACELAELCPRCGVTKK